MIETMPRPAGAPEDGATYGALTVRLPRELIDQIKAMAKAEERSINYVAARLMRQALGNRQQQQLARELRRERGSNADDGR